MSTETSAFKLQTPGKFPEEYELHSEHGESLKTTILDKNRSGRRSTSRTDVEELNLENREVTIRSRRFHIDNKLEMAVREWWRMEHPNFYPDSAPPPQTYAKTG